MLRNTIYRLRMIGMAEGASYIALLGIAMPLKYMMDQPLAVRIVGPIHGALFIIYVIALVQAWADRSWKLGMAAKAFIACLLPFGPFVIDAQLKEQQGGPDA